MNRKLIKEYIRILADELTEAPEGLFTNLELDLLINLSQQSTALVLFPHIPWAITKSFLISVTANKREYIVETDFSLSDFFMMDGIFHNESGYRQAELLYMEKDQLVEYNIIGRTDDPKVWSWESMGVIAFDPCPDQTVANKYKGVYVPIFEDLNDDETHDPENDKYAIPFNGSSILKPTHPLIALDVMKQWVMRSGVSSAEIDKRYNNTLRDVLFAMSQVQGLTWRGRPDIKEIIGKLKNA